MSVSLERTPLLNKRLPPPLRTQNEMSAPGAYSGKCSIYTFFFYKHCVFLAEPQYAQLSLLLEPEICLWYAYFLTKNH